MIELSCPGCGHHLRISNNFVGTSGKCKYCGETIDVPINITTTPSDLDTTVPGSNPHSPDKELGNIDPLGGSGFPFENIMDNKKSPQIGGIDNDPTLVTANPLGLDTPKPAVQPVATLTDDHLGCLFWGTAFFVPPAGLIWSLFIPPDHDHRGKGILVSVVMLVIAISAFAASYQFASHSAGMFDDFSSAMNSADGFVGEEEDSFFDSIVEVVTQAPIPTVTLHGIDVPLLKSLVLQPSTPIQLQDGTLQNVSPGQLSFYTGSVQADYIELGMDYQTAFMAADWNYEMIGGYDAAIGSYIDLYGTVNGKEFYLRITETTAGVSVTFVTRTN